MGSSNAEGSGGGEETRCVDEETRCVDEETRCIGEEMRCVDEETRFTGDASGYRSSDCVDTMGASNGKFKRARSPWSSRAASSYFFAAFHSESNVPRYYSSQPISIPTIFRPSTWIWAFHLFPRLYLRYYSKPSQLHSTV